MSATAIDEAKLGAFTGVRVRDRRGHQHALMVFGEKLHSNEAKADAGSLTSHEVVQPPGPA